MWFTDISNVNSYKPRKPCFMESKIQDSEMLIKQTKVL